MGSFVGGGDCRRNQAGVALILALLILLILTLLGISAIQTTTFETSIAGNLRIYNLAFNAADGGIDSFRGMLSLPSGDPNRRLIETVTDLPMRLAPIYIGESICKLQIEDISDREEEEGKTYKVYTIRSVGVVPNAAASSTVTIEAVVEAGTSEAAPPDEVSLTSTPAHAEQEGGMKVAHPTPVRLRSWREIF